MLALLGDNTYYVSSTTSSDCPQPCHPLSYYITDTATYFTANTTFIFMEGEHLLDSKGSVQVVINYVDNLTLRGVRSDFSTSTGHGTGVIICSSNTRGMLFKNGNIINIHSITITGCGEKHIPPLQISNITSIYVHRTILHNNTAVCALCINLVTDTHITVTDSIITDCTIYINDDQEDWGGGLYIYSDTDTHTCNNIIVSDCVFNDIRVIGHGITGGGGLVIFSSSSYTYMYGNTHNNIVITNTTIANNTVNFHVGGGLLVIGHGTDIHNTITITNSNFAHNICGDTKVGGGLVLLMLSSNRMYASITTTNSTFTNNIGGYIYGGGLLIATPKPYTQSNVTIACTNSIFTGNIAKYIGGGLAVLDTGSDTSTNIHVTITNSVFNSNIIGEGGGLAILDSDVDAFTNITIINSMFANNDIESGGGLYVLSTHMTITSSKFISNRVHGMFGAALLIVISNNTWPNYINITNSAFTDNVLDKAGGGVYISEAIINIFSNITITDCTFTNNIALHMGGGLAIAGTGGHNITIADSMFHNNFGCGLLFTFLTDTKVILSQVRVTNSYYSGIEAMTHITIIFTKGNSIIANNSSPTDGGGIFLGKSSYLTTGNGGHVSFISNTAHRYGGAIYSSDNDYGLLTTIILQNEFDTQCTVYNLSATFINNSAARAGDVLYGGVFIFCNYAIPKVNDPYDNIPLILDCFNVPNTTKVPSVTVHPLSSVSSNLLVACLCVNDTIDCDTRSLNKKVYPGQVLDVSMVTVGLCGGVNPGTVVVEHEKYINLISSATTDYTSTSCTTFNYAVKMTNYMQHVLKNTSTFNTTITLNVADGDFYKIAPITMYLSILPCPIGLVANYTSGDCVCNDAIAHVSAIICNISWVPYPILRSGNNWISHLDDYNCMIAHDGCPFDYCNTAPIKFNLNESDRQCNYNRYGTLCGRCKQGLSLMIGSNRCTDCTDNVLVSVSILIIAAVAGIVLVILLIVLNLTVSAGSINGVLFYANLVKLNESVFFSQGNIPVVTQFISWCNLDMGFEYCFINGLDGYVKTWLQFLFPLYVWVLVIVIIVGCRYSGRLSRLTGHNAVPVLATLILMSYTKLSRNITNALMMNTLQCGERKWNVWNVDGNIHYLSGRHIVLFVVSLLFLFIGLIYTGSVFSSQWLQHYSGMCCESTRDPVVYFKPLIDAYTGSLKDKYRFWTGLCLIVRLVLTVMFSFTTTSQSKLNNYIIQVIVGAMIVFSVGARTYKDKRLTALETFSFINLICLCTMINLFTECYHDAVPISVIVSVSVSIEMLLFIGIIIVHSHIALKKVFPKCKLFYKIKATSNSTDELQPLISTSEEQDYGLVHREPMIYAH